MKRDSAAAAKTRSRDAGAGLDRPVPGGSSRSVPLGWIGPQACHGWGRTTVEDAPFRTITKLGFSPELLVFRPLAVIHTDYVPSPGPRRSCPSLLNFPAQIRLISLREESMTEHFRSNRLRTRSHVKKCRAV